jgi:hypothetical protein
MMRSTKLATSLFALVSVITSVGMSAKVGAVESSAAEPASSTADPLGPVVASTLTSTAPPPSTPLTFNTDLRSRAQQIAQKLPKDVLISVPNAAPRVGPQNPGGGVQVLEEIVVTGKFDPADFTARKTAPMLVFRASLDGQRPMTPKEISNSVLCFIGLCPLLNANGLPIADTTPEQRAQARLNTPFTPGFGPGTFQ